MYLRILKKDIKRKKTMNTILLIFIILASMFIASSANNILTITNALDHYFEKANVPVCTFNAESEVLEAFEAFAKENDYQYSYQDIVVVEAKDILLGGRTFDYNNVSLWSSPEEIYKVFDSDDKEITHINDGEIWMDADVFYENQDVINIGDEIEVTVGGMTKTFILKGCMKDAIYGTPFMGVTRFMISENDLALLMTEAGEAHYSVRMYTDDEDYYQKYIDLGLNVHFFMTADNLTYAYVMDILIAAVMLVVSICMILISMVILNFTINFTISEEFREIGVMKAIGLKSSDIRGLYIIKYLAIAIVGAAIGFILSIPFGDMMLKDVSQRIMLSSTGGILLNLFFAALVAGIVVFFCWNCTRKMKKLSPVDAIRNGETGERFNQKSKLHLAKFRLAPVGFMALNDICSGIKKFVSMILIFMLGILLIILPLNTINTLRSDRLITWFGMAECDHIITKDVPIASNADNKQVMLDGIEEVQTFLSEQNIEAEVFQEVGFRVTVTYQGKKALSWADQGLGGITTDQYAYTEGTAPMNIGEVAITGKTAESIDVHIGDTVEITNGEETKSYIVTAFFQSMSNMGEGIHFHPEEPLDYTYVAGYFPPQIRYTDSPSQEMITERKEILKKHFPECEIYAPGAYVNDMIGDIAGQIDNVKSIILIIVLVINMLVTILMVKSFITKEKGEIAILKAIGFRNTSLIAWQSLRIGIVLLIAILLAVLISTPLSQLVIAPIFRMMGAQTIEFVIIPLEVYVFYPLVVLGVTVLSGILAALQVRKIKASDTANIE